MGDKFLKRRGYLIMSDKLKSIRRLLVKKTPLPIKKYLKKQRVIRLSTAFFSDRYWSEALEEVLRHCSDEQSGYAMVHPDMLPKVDNSVPYGYSFTLSSADSSVVCIHKGLADELSTKFIEGLLETHTLVFSNAVFCVYSNLNASGDNETSQYEEHAFDFQGWLQSRAKKRAIKRFNNDQNQERNTVSNILIVTANNFGNVGDDAITHAAYELISRVFPKATVTLDNCPIKRDDVESTDLLVLGGGGLYYDGDIRNAINYTNLMFFAEEANIPHIGIGLGTQGIRTDVGKHLFKHALNGAALTVVRDPKDKHYLSEIGVTSPIEITNDIVFSLLPTDKEPGEGRANKKNMNVGVALFDKRLGLTLTNPDSYLTHNKQVNVYQQGIVDCVKYLKKKGYKIIYICQSQDDLDLYLKLQRDFGGEIKKISYKQSKYGYKFYEDLDLLITSRFHGLVFAMLSATPVISVGTNGLKTERLICNSVPSLKNCHIRVGDFHIDNIKNYLEIWQQEPSKFIANKAEVDSCRASAMMTVEHLKKYVGF